MAAARDALAADEAARLSARIRDRLLAGPEAARAGSVFIYVSQGNEVDTRALIGEFLRQGKTVTVPLITGEGTMEAHRITCAGDLSPGKFGIHAPRSPRPFAGDPDLAVCPGVAFTARGDRLGRGKGYYDRFLAGHPGSFAVGLCYDFQVVDEIPSSPEDRPVALIVTESRAIRTSGKMGTC